MKRTLMVLGTLLIGLLFVQCGKKEEPKKEDIFEQPAEEETTEEPATSEADPNEAKAQTNCYLCHNNDPEGASRLAPHFSEIVTIYKDAGNSKEETIAKMVAFAKAPSEDKVLDKAALEKYGAMNAILLDDAELQGIVGYIVEKNYP